MCNNTSCVMNAIYTYLSWVPPLNSFSLLSAERRAERREPAVRWNAADAGEQLRLQVAIQLTFEIAQKRPQKNSLKGFKICLKIPCTASTALLALIEVQGLLRQILHAIISVCRRCCPTARSRTSPTTGTMASTWAPSSTTASPAWCPIGTSLIREMGESKSVIIIWIKFKHYASW